MGDDVDIGTPFDNYPITLRDLYAEEGGDFLATIPVMGKSFIGVDTPQFLNAIDRYFKLSLDLNQRDTTAVSTRHPACLSSFTHTESTIRKPSLVVWTTPWRHVAA
jgi:hypothetical protein